MEKWQMTAAQDLLHRFWFSSGFASFTLIHFFQQSYLCIRKIILIIVKAFLTAVRPIYYYWIISGTWHGFSGKVNSYVGCKWVTGTRRTRRGATGQLYSESLQERSKIMEFLQLQRQRWRWSWNLFLEGSSLCWGFSDAALAVTSIPPESSCFSRVKVIQIPC